MKHALFILLCIIAASCSSSHSEEDEIYNVLMLNELDTHIKILSIDSEAKDRYCYPIVIQKTMRSSRYLEYKKNLQPVYQRFKEDSIAGFPAIEGGIPSKKVRYQLSTGEKKEVLAYFGKGGMVLTLSLGVYDMCH